MRGQSDPNLWFGTECSVRVELWLHGEHLGDPDPARVANDTEPAICAGSVSASVIWARIAGPDVGGRPRAPRIATHLYPSMPTDHAAHPDHAAH
jgi:hypothetical protein